MDTARILVRVMIHSMTTSYDCLDDSPLRGYDVSGAT